MLRRVVPEYRDAAARGQVETLDVAVLSPDPAAAVRHRRLPADASRRRGCRASGSGSPEDAAEQLRGPWRSTSGCSAAGRWGSGRRKGRCRTRWCRSSRPPASTGWRPTKRSWRESLGRGFSRDGAWPRRTTGGAVPRRIASGGTATVACGFRDHTLSDLIGFTYASWPPEAAADDFVQRLAERESAIAARTDGGEATIFVILDGENAWEHYEGQGRPFLRALYRRLGSHPALTTVTMAEACAGAEGHAAVDLPRVVDQRATSTSGSATPDDHRAWSQLADARRALDGRRPGVPPEALARAREEMLIAEGQRLVLVVRRRPFLRPRPRVRRSVPPARPEHLPRASMCPIPEELFVTNITTQPPPTGSRAADRVHPSGHRRRDDELLRMDWRRIGRDRAGRRRDAPGVGARGSRVGASSSGSTWRTCMSGSLVRRPMRDVISGDQQLSLNFLKPEGWRIVVGQCRRRRAGAAGRRGPRKNAWRRRSCPDIKVAAGRMLELRVPFQCLGASNASRRSPSSSRCNTAVAEVEHHPRHRPIEVQVPRPAVRRRGTGPA